MIVLYNSLRPLLALKLPLIILKLARKFHYIRSLDYRGQFAAGYTKKKLTSPHFSSKNDQG